VNLKIKLNNIFMARVVVGISGGVDSSVAAYLLKEQGHDVIGMFMINWHDTEGLVSGDCPLHDDEIFAKLVCKKLDIPLHIVDLSDTYYKRVTEYMFNEYENGRTPNPDVLCNREIKFDAFLEEALKLGADYVATGHYCQKTTTLDSDGNEVHHLIAGADDNKDQSYFLCQLNQYQLSKALFPIGHLEKPEVRRIAEEQGLATAKRKDSQGICFVGKVNLPDFLKQKLKAKEGDIVEIPATYWEYDSFEYKYTPRKICYNKNDGKVIGKHNGAHFFTIGQSKYLGIGGRKEKMFVIGTDVVNNIVYVGEGQNHPGLYRKTLFIKTNDIHIINHNDLMSKFNNGSKIKVRIRYRQPLQDAKLIKVKDGIIVWFDEPQRGVTPGQFAAFYSNNNELIASGIIDFN
jgi:tRNA-specific 2-thiouridylase